MDLSARIIHSHRGGCLFPIQAQAKPPQDKKRVDPPWRAARPCPPWTDQWRANLSSPPNTPPPDPPPPPPTTPPPAKAAPRPSPPTTPPPGLPAAPPGLPADSAPPGLPADSAPSSAAVDDALRSRQDELPSDEVLPLVQVRSSLPLELMGKRLGKKMDRNWI